MSEGYICLEISMFLSTKIDHHFIHSSKNLNDHLFYRIHI